tara:strand:+ start:1252 stop:1560 length:309 start_codon:yes stop_codon:yes gene_type:complete
MADGNFNWAAIIEAVGKIVIDVADSANDFKFQNQQYSRGDRQNQEQIERLNRLQEQELGRNFKLTALVLEKKNSNKKIIKRAAVGLGVAAAIVIAGYYATRK